jgi:hypothetical protein
MQFFLPDDEVWKGFNLDQQMMLADAPLYTIYNLKMFTIVL